MTAHNRVAILGGTGFIGLHLARQLLVGEDCELTLVDNLSRGRLDSEIEDLLESNPQIRFVEADLTTPEAYRNLGHAFDQVYVLAGIVGVRLTHERPDRVAYVNSMIILQALEWARGMDAKLLYASTSEAYAGATGFDPRCRIPTGEDTVVAIDDVTNPRSTYAASKIMGETAVLAYRQVHGQRATIVRYHNVFGPRMGYEHVIPELTVRLLEGHDPCVVYGCDQSRAFCYVSDAVRATVAAMEKPEADGEIFHIGTDREILIEDLARSLCDVASRHPQLQQEPAPTGSVQRRCPDISKARSILAYEPQASLEDGLSQTFEWYSRAFQTRQGPT